MEDYNGIAISKNDKEFVVAFDWKYKIDVIPSFSRTKE